MWLASMPAPSPWHGPHSSCAPNWWRPQPGRVLEEGDVLGVGPAAAGVVLGQVGGVLGHFRHPHRREAVAAVASAALGGACRRSLQSPGLAGCGAMSARTPSLCRTSCRRRPVSWHSWQRLDHGELVLHVGRPAVLCPVVKTVKATLGLPRYVVVRGRPSSPRNRCPSRSLHHLQRSPPSPCRSWQSTHLGVKPQVFTCGEAKLARSWFWMAPSVRPSAPSFVAVPPTGGSSRC